QMIRPSLQRVAPAAQTPGRPLEQATPPPGFPLSLTPSQLLSRPSQISGCEPTATRGLHTSAPPVHAVVPGPQAPGNPDAQMTPLPGLPLSFVPLQSL